MLWKWWIIYFIWEMLVFIPLIFECTIHFENFYLGWLSLRTSLDKRHLWYNHVIHRIFLIQESRNYSLVPSRFILLYWSVELVLQLAAIAIKNIAMTLFIIYRTGKEVHFGRIHRIFTVDGGNVLFQIFTLASSTSCTCETADDQFCCDEIRTGKISAGTTTCIINGEQIIEKCVFYLQPNGHATFMRFPNLEESS